MKLNLWNYQESSAISTINALNVYDRVLLEMPTGSGKTFTSIYIINEIIKKSNKAVLFIAHKQELIEQFALSFKRALGTDAEIIDSSVKVLKNTKKCYSAMVETLYNRLEDDPDFITQEIGLIVVDEAHFNLYGKLLDKFKGTKILGITGTPVSTNYLNPLNRKYQHIVSKLKTKDLININKLCRVNTFIMSSEIDLEKVPVDERGEYNTKALQRYYQRSKNIQNCVNAYERHSLGRKTIVFNCSVEHSDLVNQAFLNAGYNSRVLYGSHSLEYREEVLNWFKNTPDAILHNVNVLIAGYDEPSINTVIFNRDTLSLSLWIQAVGRGARVMEGKSEFTVIDLGTNSLRLGEWDYEYDWSYIFNNPPNKKQLRSSNKNSKPCRKCDMLISTRTPKCPNCGEIYQDVIDSDMKKSKTKRLAMFIESKYGQTGYTHKYSNEGDKQKYGKPLSLF